MPGADEYGNLTQGGMDAEGVSAEWICLDGCAVFRLEDREYISYVWTNNDYLFTMNCSCPISEETIQAIFRSVQIDPEAEIDGA